jgi:hypothetical protein
VGNFNETMDYAEDLIKVIEEDKDLGMVIKEMNAELREDEYLDDKHVDVGFIYFLMEEQREVYRR